MLLPYQIWKWYLLCWCINVFNSWLHIIISPYIGLGILWFEFGHRRVACMSFMFKLLISSFMDTFHTPWLFLDHLYGSHLVDCVISMYISDKMDMFQHMTLPVRKVEDEGTPSCYQMSSLNENKAKQEFRKHPTLLIKYPFYHTNLTLLIVSLI